MQKIVRWIGIILLVVVLILTGDIRQEQIRFESDIPENELSGLEKKIRVLIKTDDFQEILHKKIEVFAEHGIVCRTEEGQEIDLKQQKDWFQNGKIYVCSKKEDDPIILKHLHRACGNPSYEGHLEVYPTEKGLAIINEIDIEDYLEQVVPSEMPSSYELEALKAQAICARSYAYRQIESIAYSEYNAHVDDSTSFQVYGNSRKTEKTSQAVKETVGQIVQYQGAVAATYFFSTSSGRTADIEAWNVKNAENYPYLQDVEVIDTEGNAYEEDLPWYRWSVEMEKSDLQAVLEKYSGETVGQLKNIKIKKRGKSGIVLQLEAVGTEGKMTVEFENQIRDALGDERFIVKRQDGSEVFCGNLLPSAFFTIREENDSYVVEGGGHGHGIGMSQNGANEMAKEGKNCEEILQFFYPGTNLAVK